MYEAKWNVYRDTGVCLWRRNAFLTIRVTFRLRSPITIILRIGKSLHLINILYKIFEQNEPVRIIALIILVVNGITPFLCSRIYELCSVTHSIIPPSASLNPPPIKPPSAAGDAGKNPVFKGLAHQIGSKVLFSIWWVGYTQIQKHAVWKRIRRGKGEKKAAFWKMRAKR